MSDEPAWSCEVCRKPVSDGYLEFRYPEWDANREASAAWEDRHRDEHGFVLWSASDGDRPPGHVPWHVLHRTCDSNPDSATVYTIEITRIRTWRDVAAWSAHLHEKRWFGDTGWSQLLYRAGVR